MTSDPTALLLATAFSIFGALCVALVLVGLPGAWLLIATAIAIDCLDWIWLAPNAPLTFHPLTIVVAVLIATAGEAMEFALSAAGAKRFGASRAGMIGAMIGGAIGAIGGTVADSNPRDRHSDGRSVRNGRGRNHRRTQRQKARRQGDFAQRHRCPRNGRGARPRAGNTGKAADRGDRGGVAGDRGLSHLIAFNRAQGTNFARLAAQTQRNISHREDGD